MNQFHPHNNKIKSCASAAWPPRPRKRRRPLRRTPELDDNKRLIDPLLALMKTYLSVRDTCKATTDCVGD